LDENTIQFVNREARGGIYADAQIGDYAVQYMFDDYDLETGMPVPSGGTDISNTSNTNPGAKVLERERRDKKFKLFGSVYAKYDFSDKFSFRTALSGDYQDTRRTRYQGTLSSRNGASATQSDYSNTGSIHLVTDNLFSYNDSFGDHEVSAIAGISAEKTNVNYASLTGTGYDFDFVKTINAASNIAGGTSYEYENTLLSYYARGSYAYRDKYLASASYRLDGSSVFGSDNKYGDFYALSLGWNLAKEDFLSSSPVISNLKLRFSYGTTGNNALDTGSDLIDNYPSVALLSATTAIINGGAATGFNPINIANPNLKWERSNEINPGIDFGFINNRISGSLDLYKRTSDQLLLYNPISGTTGFSNALVNLGEVENKGFEFELRTKNIMKEKFSWTSTVIVSKNENTLTDFGDANGQIQNVDDKRASEWINLVGNPISSFYGWVVDKEIPLEYIKTPFHPVGGQAQDVYVKDLNGDGLIDDDDKTILGNPYPELVWSFTNNFALGNFDLSIMFQGSHGAEVRNMADQYMFNHFNSGQDFNPAITPDQGFIKEKIFTNSIIQDASYVTMRTINLGYNFDEGLLSKTGINRLRVYVTGQNLMYFTADGYTGWNPESISDTSPTTYGYQLGGNPIKQTISLGLNLDF
jgi:TonB-linked SusC/RagA family outer membrane protein